MTPPLTGAAVFPHRELTDKVVGAAMEVHNQLGPGFLESVYEEALRLELELRGVGSEPQAVVDVFYKGHAIGHYVADLLVDGVVLCEIKAVGALAPQHDAQLLNYLKATQTKVGLLLNFGTRRLQVKRMIF